MFVTVDAEVKSTEDEGKVMASILNVFPTVSFETLELVSRKHVIGRVLGLEGLEQFRSFLSRERILAAARRVMIGSIENGRIVFCINKQVAFAKRVSFCEAEGESPLGPIKVTVDAENIDQLIDWLAPKVKSSQSRKETSTTIKSSARKTSGKTRLAPLRKHSSSS